MAGNPSLCKIHQIKNGSPNGTSIQNIHFDEKHVFLRMCLDFVAGCLGGCAGVLVGHPFDTVKVHIQTQDPRKPVYRGTINCLMTLIRQEGFRSLYRGMTSPLMGVSFVNAIVFGVYGNVQRQMENPNSLKSHFLAGCIAGFSQSIVCSPMELAKTRMQLQSAQQAIKFKCPLECIQHIIRTEGLRGAFRGLGMTAARDMPGFASYFVSYEWMMSLPDKPNTLYALTAGGMAGIASWWACYPIDVVKTLIQADGMSSKPVYKNSLDCAVRNYRKEGFHFFFRGLNSTMVRAFPMNAACFYVVSWVLSFTKDPNVNLTVQTTDPLAIDSFKNVDQQLAYFHQQEATKAELKRKRSFMVRSLQALGAFQDSVCHDDIEELADEFYPNDDTKYYIFEDERILFNKMLPDDS